MRSPLAADLGIYIRNEKPGERRASCPECRKTKVRRSDDALAVKIDPDGGATWLCHRCGWAGGLAASGDKRVFPNGTTSRQPQSRCATDAAAEGSETNREAAQEIWRQSTTITHGCPAWTYLTEGRRIRTWHPERLLWHPECPFRGRPAPAIVAPLNCHKTGHVIAVWRIELDRHGNKVGRFGLGPTKGNASRLFWAEGPKLVIAEGVEDALAAAELFGLPTWAALSAGFMADLVLPRHFREVLIVADWDENGVGLNGASKLARRLRAEGRTAEVRWPKTHKDPNDVVLARRTAS